MTHTQIHTHTHTHSYFIFDNIVPAIKWFDSHCAWCHILLSRAR